MSVDDEHEDQDPTEEVGPEKSEVSPDYTEIQPGALDGPPEEAQADFADEASEAFTVEASPLVPHPVDGMPVPGNEISASLALAPSFSIENVVCIEDERSFVELFRDELPSRDSWRDPMVVVDRDRYLDDGSERARMVFVPSRVERRFGLRVVRLAPDEWTGLRTELVAEGVPFAEPEGDAMPWVLVRPVRERCVNYKRQVYANDNVPKGEFGSSIVFRNCIVRRSVGGAFLSLSNQAIYACDYRSPAHPESVQKHLDQKDAERLAARIEEVPLFNLQDPPEGAGIYRAGRGESK